MTFDPEVLRRKTWTDPNELANELYVLFKHFDLPPKAFDRVDLAARPAGPAILVAPTVAQTVGRAPIYDMHLPVASPGVEVPAVAAPARPGEPTRLRPVPEESLTGKFLDLFLRAHPEVAAAPPPPGTQHEFSVSQPTSHPQPEIKVERSATGPTGAPRPGQPFEPQRPPEIHSEWLPVAPSVAPAVSNPRLRGSDVPVAPRPVEAVDVRVQTPTAPSQPAQGIRTRIPEGVARTREQLAFPAQQVPVTLNSALPRRPPAQGQDTTGEDWGYRPIDVPYGERLPQLAYITTDGIPGCVIQPQQYGPPRFVVGKGKATLYTWVNDRQTMEPESGEQVDIWNYSVLPISGEQLWPVFILLDGLLAVPPMWAHAVVTTAITACAGTTPGTGAVQTYFKKGGVMTADQTLDTENWFNVTAAVSKHCTVGWVSSKCGLEVLDC